MLVIWPEGEMHGSIKTGCKRLCPVSRITLRYSWKWLPREGTRSLADHHQPCCIPSFKCAIYLLPYKLHIGTLPSHSPVAIASTAGAMWQGIKIPDNPSLMKCLGDSALISGNGWEAKNSVSCVLQSLWVKGTHNFLSYSMCILKKRTSALKLSTGKHPGGRKPAPSMSGEINGTCLLLCPSAASVTHLWGNTAKEVFEKGKKIVQILLKASFAITQSEVKGQGEQVFRSYMARCTSSYPKGCNQRNNSYVFTS